MAARPGFEPGPPASEAGVVPVPPPRTVFVWTERFELPTPGSRSRCASVAPRPGVLRWCRTDGGSRTRTDGGLSAVPLPVGLRQQVVQGGPRGIRTRTLLLAGELRSRCASGPGCAARWTRGRESNPRAGRMRPRCTQCPRSVTGRTRTGFLRGHVPASRPLRTSVTVDEEGLEPPASSM